MRRSWVAAVLSALAVAGCAAGGAQRSPETLTARPTGGGGSCAAGMHRLEVGGARAFMRVTAGSRRGRKALILALHGAGGGAKDGLRVFRGGWGAPGLVIVAPGARGQTWSALYGKDVDLRTLDRALRAAFRRCRIDPRRVAVGGFSDGASYALSLGLANGRLFHAIMALSPGGIVTMTREGKPRVFIAHGTRDRTLPFDSTRDRIVSSLRREGYRVTFRPFPGGHTVREGESRAAVRWFLSGR